MRVWLPTATLVLVLLVSKAERVAAANNRTLYGGILFLANPKLPGGKYQPDHLVPVRPILETAKSSQPTLRHHFFQA